jgi:hypothetical protein
VKEEDTGSYHFDAYIFQLIRYRTESRKVFYEEEEEEEEVVVCALTQLEEKERLSASLYALHSIFATRLT